MSGDRLYLTAKKVAEQLGYSCWGVEFNAGRRRASLRVFIDRPEGITLDDCSAVSHQLGGVLDVERMINKPYTLEVSSPGIDRLLFEISHYRRYIGSRVRVSCHAPIEGKRKFVGKIEAVSSRTVTLKTDTSNVEIPVDGVKQARLLFEPAKTT